MSYYSCGCAYCRINGLCWPLVLLSAGVVFSLDLIWHVWPVWKTWPALLIVAGLCKLIARLAPANDHAAVRPLAQPGGPHAS